MSHLVVTADTLQNLNLLTNLLTCFLVLFFTTLMTAVKGVFLILQELSLIVILLII